MNILTSPPQVHIPSAKLDESDDMENTFSDSFEEESGTDMKDSDRFPGFNKGELDNIQLHLGFEIHLTLIF